MLFAIQILSTTGESIELESRYRSGTDAAAAVATLKANNPTNRYRIIRVETAATIDWRARERGRFESGAYKALPAHNFTPRASSAVDDHFAHVSTDKSGMIAFTESSDKGIADKQTRIRPARYISRYYNVDSDIARDYAARFAAENDTGNVLRFAVTADEIEDIYVSGPSSCMSHKANSYDSPVHPTRAYAGPDLQLAYMERGGAVTARAIIWPAKKRNSRIYGDESRFGALLDAAGYKPGSLRGARLTAIAVDDEQYVMPYIDDVSSAHVDGKHIVLGGGDLSCTTTDGLSRGPRYVCEHCEEDVDEVYGVDDESWCESCVDCDAFFCEGCDSYCNDANRHDESSYCIDCAPDDDDETETVPGVPGVYMVPSSWGSIDCDVPFTREHVILRGEIREKRALEVFLDRHRLDEIETWLGDKTYWLFERYHVSTDTRISVGYDGATICFDDADTLAAFVAWNAAAIAAP